MFQNNYKVRLINFSDRLIVWTLKFDLISVKRVII